MWFHCHAGAFCIAPKCSDTMFSFPTWRVNILTDKSPDVPLCLGLLHENARLVYFYRGANLSHNALLVPFQNTKLVPHLNLKLYWWKDFNTKKGLIHSYRTHQVRKLWCYVMLVYQTSKPIPNDTYQEVHNLRMYQIKNASNWRCPVTSQMIDY